MEPARGTARGSDRGRDRYDRYDRRGGGGSGGRYDSKSSRNSSRYGPPLRTEYRLIVENLSTRVSWQVSQKFSTYFLSRFLLFNVSKKIK